MDKGIRPATNRMFVELLPQRATLGNTGFRKTVMAAVMEEFGITLASAATHYNHAFKTAKEAGVDCGDLGRPEDKKGGRKPKATVTATEVVAPWPFPTTEDHPSETPAEAAPVVETAPEQAPHIPETLQEATVQLVTVRRKKDGVVIAENVALQFAEDMVAKAKAAKKAALEIA